MFTFLDLIGQIGGIYELLEVFAAFFVGYYNGKMFNYALVNKLNSSTIDDQTKNKNENRDEHNHELIHFNRQYQQVIQNNNESTPYPRSARRN